MLSIILSQSKRKKHFLYIFDVTYTIYYLWFDFNNRNAIKTQDVEQRDIDDRRSPKSNNEGCHEAVALSPLLTIKVESRWYGGKRTLRAF